MPSGYGMDLILVLYSRVLSYRSVKRAQMQAGGLGTYFATYLHQVSCVTELCCSGIPVSFAYLLAMSSIYKNIFHINLAVAK